MKNHQIGRNDPCPCGSGKKHKKCCLNKTNLQGKPIVSAPPEIIKQFQERQRKENKRISEFGQVRPGIGTDFKGYKVVAVGSRVFLSKK